MSVGAEEVPVLIREESMLLKVDWDLSLLRIIPHIDGVRCVKMIAIAAEMDVDVVQGCVRVLLWHRCVVLVDLFRYSNIYATSPDVASLLCDSSTLDIVMAQASSLSFPPAGTAAHLAAHHSARQGTQAAIHATHTAHAAHAAQAAVQVV